MTDRVIVVGAGVIGICTALSLLEKGMQVEIIDRDPPAEGASHGNAGVVSPWTCVPQSIPGIWKKVPKWLIDPEGPVAVRPGYLFKFLPWVIRFLKAADPAGLPAIADGMSALNRPNVDLYRRHLDGTGKEHLLADSMYVHVFRDPAGADLSQLAWRLREERDVPMQLVNGDELREIEPDVSPDYKAAILLKDQARALDPAGIGKALFEKAMAMGATFRQTEVNRIQPAPEGGWTVTTPEGEVAAPKLVIAAGAWSARLLAPLGFKLPLEAERGYHMVFKNPGVAIRNSIMEADAKYVASSMEAGIRFAGTAEFAGIDAAPDYRRARIFQRLAKKLLPGIDTSDGIEWMGRRPSFPDSLPCLGTVPGMEGLYCAFGHSHYGFGMAPNTGRVVAEVVAGATPNIDMSPYRIERFS